MPSEICVTELPSKQPFHIALPSEEGGDMLTMEKFVSLIEDKVSRTWVRLMVGDRRIDMKTDGFRSVRFFLLDGSPWYLHTAMSACFEVFIKCPRKTITIRTSRYETIKSLKLAIQHREGVPVKDQRLQFEGCQPMDERMLVDYNIRKDCIITLLVSLPGGGGGCARGMPFVDVTDAGPTTIQWSSKAPKWRIAHPGLCLEGKCTNRRCSAFKQMVIMNRGFVEFDFIEEQHECQCPICKQYVVPTTCGFNNCCWKVVGRKVEFRKPPQAFKSDWKSAGDAYDRFSPDEHGVVHFLDLKILCKQFQLKTCVACGCSKNEETAQIATCGHSFHKVGCFDFAISADRACMECVAKRSMTSSQKKFG